MIDQHLNEQAAVEQQELQNRSKPPKLSFGSIYMKLETMLGLYSIVKHTMTVFHR